MTIRTSVATVPIPGTPPILTTAATPSIPDISASVPTALISDALINIITTVPRTMPAGRYGGENGRDGRIESSGSSGEERRNDHSGSSENRDSNGKNGSNDHMRKRLCDCLHALDESFLDLAAGCCPLQRTEEEIRAARSAAAKKGAATQDAKRRAKRDAQLAAVLQICAEQQARFHSKYGDGDGSDGGNPVAGIAA